LPYIRTVCKHRYFPNVRIMRLVFDDVDLLQLHQLSQLVCSDNRHISLTEELMWNFRQS